LRSWSLSFLRGRALAESKAELMGTRMPEDPGREPGRGTEADEEAVVAVVLDMGGRLRMAALGAPEAAAREAEEGTIRAMKLSQPFLSSGGEAEAGLGLFVRVPLWLKAAEYMEEDAVVAMEEVEE
jgi:hypothetical protein